MKYKTEDWVEESAIDDLIEKLLLSNKNIYVVLVTHFVDNGYLSDGEEAIGRTIVPHYETNGCFVVRGQDAPACVSLLIQADVSITKFDASSGDAKFEVDDFLIYADMEGHIRRSDIPSEGDGFLTEDEASKILESTLNKYTEDNPPDFWVPDCIVAVNATDLWEWPEPSWASFVWTNYFSKTSAGAKL